MESVRITLLSCFVAAFLVVGTHAQCGDDQATAMATTCTTDFSQAFAAAAAADIFAYCSSSEDAIADLETCVNDALASCDDSTKDTYTGLLSAITGPVEQSCAAVTGGGAGAGSGVDPCLLTLGRCFGTELEFEQVGSIFSDDGDATQSAEQQEEICRSLDDVDFGGIKECLEEDNCADFSIGGQPGTPVPTASGMVDMIAGLCKEGCENYKTKIQALEVCDETIDLSEVDIEQAQCGDIDTYFSCVRGGIGSCDTLKDTLMEALTSLDVLDGVRDRCPNANLALTEGDSDSATSTKGLFFLIATALFFSLFL